MSTALSIKGKTQANDAVTSTINYVNPNATNAQLQSLASAMNDLTTNTIVDVTRIDKNSLTSAVTKLPRNAKITNAEDQEITSIAASSLAQDIGDIGDSTFNIVYNDSAEAMPIQVAVTDQYTLYLTRATARGTGAAGGLMIVSIGENTATEIKLYIPEDATYQSAELTLSITAD